MSESKRLWRIPEDDADLLERLLDLGLIDDEDADSLEDQSEQDGTDRPPCAYAVDRGLVTNDQLRRLYLSLHHLNPTCYHCLKRTKVAREGFDGTYVCKGCSELVSFLDQTAGLAEGLLPHLPSRIVDNILQQLLIKKKRLTKKQVERLKQKRKAIVPRPSLFSMIAERDLVLERRLTRLLRRSEDFYEMLMPAKKLAEDYRLACFLLRLAICGQVGLSGALIKQLDVAMTGDYVPLRGLLQEAGELTETQIADWLPDFFDDRDERATLMAPLAAVLPPEEDYAEEDEEEEEAKRKDVEELLERGGDWSMSEAMGDMMDDFDDDADTINVSSIGELMKADKKRRRKKKSSAEFDFGDELIDDGHGGDDEDDEDGEDSGWTSVIG